LKQASYICKLGQSFSEHRYVFSGYFGFGFQFYLQISPDVMTFLPDCIVKMIKVLVRIQMASSAMSDSVATYSDVRVLCDVTFLVVDSTTVTLDDSSCHVSVDVTLTSTVWS